jgi:hypothetical protein
MVPEGGNLYPRYGVKPVPWRAILRQSIELGAQF